MYDRATDIHNHRMAIINGKYSLPKLPVYPRLSADEKHYLRELSETSNLLEEIYEKKGWLAPKKYR